jgi:uncharacterized protein YndB with AHSA1/START domain
MSTATISPAPVRKSLVVAADLQRCFAAFTQQMGSWWPRTHSVGKSSQVAVIIEPRVGGRWYERGEDGSESEWGKVLQWEPPTRVILAWQLDQAWKYNPACLSEVEINFTPVAGAQTRVDLEHRYLERLGDNAAVVRDMLDSGWGSILGLYGEHAASG